MGTVIRLRAGIFIFGPPVPVRVSSTRVGLVATMVPPSVGTSPPDT